jgi:imidazolonepropionase-like amidohydrolase
MINRNMINRTFMQRPARTTFAAVARSLWSARSRPARNTLVCLCCAGLCGLLAASSGTGRAGPQQERASGFESHTFALVKARLVLSPDEELDQGTLVIRDGLIVELGRNVSPPPDAEVIDATGLTIYAGFIDAASSALLDAGRIPAPAAGRPIDFSRGALAATPPDNRKSLSPEFPAEQALKSDAALLEARRKLGFTAIHLLPSGRIAAGEGALLSTSGLPPREAVLSRGTFPQFQLFPPGGEGYPATLMGATAHLRQAFLDAERYRRHHRLYDRQTPGAPRPPEDPVLGSLAETLERRRPAVFVAQSRDEIHRALDFAAEQHLPAVIRGGHEAFLCASRLKSEARGVIMQVDWGPEPVIEPAKPSEKLVSEVKDALRVQQDRGDRWRQQVAGSEATPTRNRFHLRSASEGLKDPGDLLKGVRQAIAAGLPRKGGARPRSTRDAARLLGQEQRLGTLAAGKARAPRCAERPVRRRTEQGAADFRRWAEVRVPQGRGSRSRFAGRAADSPPRPGRPLATGDRLGRRKTRGDTGTQPDRREFLGSLPQFPGGRESHGGENSTVPPSSSRWRSAREPRLLNCKFQGTTAGISEGKLGGTLKSAFGAATKWSATREPAPDGPKNPVTLGLDDSEPASAPQGTGEPVPLQGAEWPTELEADRLARPLRTGGNVLIRNATVLTGLGEPLPETSVLVRAGKIAAVGRDLAPDDGMTVIDATGRFLMPGIIDTHSHIMFADGMKGVNEATVSIVPEVRVRDVIRTRDPAAYRALAGGVTTARLLHGSANVIGGQDAVVKLKFGELARDQLLHGNPQGVKFALGENVKFRTNRFPNTRLGVEATLQRAFLEALDYRRGWREYHQRAAGQPGLVAGEGTDGGTGGTLLPPRRDLRLEALADIIDQQKFIHSHCYRADEILMLLRVASGFGFRVWSLQHVLEGYKIAPEIATHGASCSTFADWWAYKVEAFDATPWNAALLGEAGVNVCLKSDDAELMRHLYQDAAKMIRYGDAAPEVALRMITLNSARELGLDQRLGSIETGKDGDFALFSGHPLNAFSRCEMTIIEGEPYFIREKQPSAMSATAAIRSAHPAALEWPAANVRGKRLDLAAAPARKYALVGATLHPIDGPDIAGGTLLVEAEKIAAVGAQVEIPADAKRIDVAGLHVYPGLIDAGTVLGLIEVGKVRETHDYEESGLFQPDLRAGVAINPDSELIPVTRAGGITAALVRPTGGVIAGQASLIKLDGWTVPEMVLDFEAALQINWPAGSESKTRIEQLHAYLAEGRTYARLRQAALDARADGPIQDPRYEALGPFLRGEKRVFIEANARKEIAEALLFAEKEQLKIVITGGADAWKLAAELKQRDVPVIVGGVMTRTREEYDPFDAQYANPGRLHEAGVTFCIRSNETSAAGFSASNSRNAPFEAAQAVAYGLPEAEGLKAMTLYPARILGVEDRMGTLTPGKQAHLIVTDGSPLQPGTHYKAIFIAGKPYAPESRHTRLYEKFRGRLHEVQVRKP